jgi:hypothetical protein
MDDSAAVFPFRSGWYWRASFVKAFCTVSIVADLGTPKILQGLFPLLSMIIVNFRLWWRGQLPLLRTVLDIRLGHPTELQPMIDVLVDEGRCSDRCLRRSIVPSVCPSPHWNAQKPLRRHSSSRFHCIATVLMSDCSHSSMMAIKWSSCR